MLQLIVEQMCGFSSSVTFYSKLHNTFWIWNIAISWFTIVIKTNDIYSRCLNDISLCIKLNSTLILTLFLFLDAKINGETKFNLHGLLKL